jgi:hypothetical protein
MFFDASQFPALAEPQRDWEIVRDGLLSLSLNQIYFVKWLGKNILTEIGRYSVSTNSAKNQRALLDMPNHISSTSRHPRLDDGWLFITCT